MRCLRYSFSARSALCRFSSGPAAAFAPSNSRPPPPAAMTAAASEFSASRAIDSSLQPHHDVGDARGAAIALAPMTAAATAAAPGPAAAAAAAALNGFGPELSRALKSVVKIFATTASPVFGMPWQLASQTKSTATGRQGATSDGGQGALLENLKRLQHHRPHHHASFICNNNIGKTQIHPRCHGLPPRLRVYIARRRRRHCRPSLVMIGQPSNRSRSFDCTQSSVCLPCQQVSSSSPSPRAASSPTRTPSPIRCMCTRSGRCALLPYDRP